MLHKIIEVTEVLNLSSDDRNISGIYCCDLPSNALGRLKKDNIWITVIASLGVIMTGLASDVSGIIITEGHRPTDEIIAIAKQRGVNLFLSPYDNLKTAEIIKNSVS